jgi:hypothetical protein
MKAVLSGTGRGTVIALLLLGVVSAGLLASCSSDEPQARAMLVKADASAGTLAADMLRLDSDIETMCADLIAGFNTEPFGIQADCTEFTKRIQNLSTKADAAKAQYEKVSSLDVPGAYKDYAKFMVQAIDTLPSIKAQLEGTVANITSTADSENGPDVKQLDSAKRTLEGVDEELRYVAGQALEARKKAGLASK